MILGAVPEGTRIGLEYVQRLGKEMHEIHSSLFILGDFANRQTYKEDLDQASLHSAVMEEIKSFDKLYMTFISLSVVTVDDLLKNEGKNYGEDKPLLEKWVEEAKDCLTTVTAIVSRMLPDPKHGILFS